MVLRFIKNGFTVHTRSEEHVRALTAVWHPMLVHGCRHRPLALSGTRHYLPEEILRLCKRRRGPLWLHVEEAYVPVKRTDDVLLFACEVAAAYHEGVARNVPREDWFRAEMQQIEDEVQRRLAEPDSENEADDPE